MNLDNQSEVGNVKVGDVKVEDIKPDDAEPIVKDGVYTKKIYYDSGQKMSEGSYVDGVQEGEWLTYHPNGNMESQITYSSGTLNGEYKRWKYQG